MGNHHYEGQRMKAMFGLIGILVMVAIVGMLVKPQFMSTTSAAAPAAAAAGATIKMTEGATPAQESKQIQKQVKDQINAAIQAAPKPEDDK
jgi:hypothetical protein